MLGYTVFDGSSALQDCPEHTRCLSVKLLSDIEMQLGHPAQLLYHIRTLHPRHLKIEERGEKLLIRQTAEDKNDVRED